MKNELVAKIVSMKAILERTELKIQEAQKEREELLDYIHECEIALEIFNNIKEPIDNPHKHFLKIRLRKGSRPYKVREILLNANRPMTVENIYRALFPMAVLMQKKVDSLRGNLNGMCEQMRVFVRTAPNTYGLLELGHK